ncbi:MAG: NAD-binding protein, partial [Desulfobacterales bacterium]|nr:NAD-binding protein [Desulfobacterales bacterium]
MSTVSEETVSQEKGDRRSGIGLFGKLIIVMLLVSISPLFVFGTIMFQESSNHIQENTQLLLDKIVEGLAFHVEEWIDKNVRMLNTAAKFPEIVSMQPESQEVILKVIQSQYPWSYLVFTVGTDGKNIARSDDKALTDYSDRDYVKEILAGKDFTWQTLIGKTSKKPALVLAVPIKSETNDIIGVLAAAMTIDDISKRIAKWKRGRTGHAFLIDEKKKVVAHQVNEYVLAQTKLDKHPLIENYLKTGQTSKSFVNEEGRLCWGSVKLIKYGWLIAAQQEQLEIFEALHRAQKYAIIVLIITVFFVVIDKNPDALRRVADNIDVQVIQGSGSNPSILEEAGIREAN